MEEVGDNGRAAAAIATTIRYEAASFTVVQLNTGVVLAFVALFCGVSKAGEGSVERVVKFCMLPYEVPEPLLALIRK